MPEISKDVVSLLAYLLPGFLVAWIFYALTTHQRPVQLERVIQALIFTLIVGGLVLLEREALLKAGHWIDLGKWSKDSDLIASILSALILGLVVSRLANTDTLHDWLRRRGFSGRSSHPNEWCMAFAKDTTYVVLELKDGRRLYGWPKIWSSLSDKGHIYLAEPIWIHGEQPVALDSTDGILVAVNDVAHVEFSKRPEPEL